MREKKKMLRVVLLKVKEDRVLLVSAEVRSCFVGCVIVYRQNQRNSTSCVMHALAGKPGALIDNGANAE
jgi:hypothetical protein